MSQFFQVELKFFYSVERLLVTIFNKRHSSFLWRSFAPCKISLWLKSLLLRSRERGFILDWVEVHFLVGNLRIDEEKVSFDLDWHSQMTHESSSIFHWLCVRPFDFHRLYTRFWGTDHVTCLLSIYCWSSRKWWRYLNFG